MWNSHGYGEQRDGREETLWQTVLGSVRLYYRPLIYLYQRPRLRLVLVVLAAFLGTVLFFALIVVLRQRW